MMVECTRKVLAINAGAVIGGISGVVPQELQGLLGGGGGGGGSSGGAARRRRVDDDDDDDDYRVEKREWLRLHDDDSSYTHVPADCSKAVSLSAGK